MDSGIKQEESPDDQPASPISQSPNATVASLHPTYHTDNGVEDSMHVVTTKRRISNPGIDANMTIAGEPGSTTLAEQTLVESMHGDEDEKEEGRKHERNLSNTSSSYVKREDQLRRSEDGQVWNHTTVDIVDVTGKPLALYDNHSAGSQKGLPLRIKGNGRSLRPPQLRLDLTKEESTMPWERIDPPLDTDVKAITGYYSPTTSQRKLTTGQRQMIPKSSYYFGPPGPDSAYGTAPVGQIGVHHPREILRVERDYTGGELIQFTAIYPLELEGRITPTQFLETINAINELLISAHSLGQTFFDNALAIFTLQLYRLVIRPHFEKEMERLRQMIDQLNSKLYNPVGLNILWPRNIAFLYLEIEYY